MCNCKRDRMPPLLCWRHAYKTCPRCGDRFARYGFSATSKSGNRWCRECKNKANKGHRARTLERGFA